MIVIETLNTRWQRVIEKLNTRWHSRALVIFMAVVLAHLAEHLVQGFQVYVLNWSVPNSRGILGQFFPWLVQSEALHYGYALWMLVGLWMLRLGFTGRARWWWMAALWIQVWHHIEHALLQGQVFVGHYLFGWAGPVSILQPFIPRVELHLIYNFAVFVPMVVAVYYHMIIAPSESEQRVEAVHSA